jgi:hypothetical protein
LAYALTGVQLDLPTTADLGALLIDLAERGWPAATLADHADATRAAGQPWPHPVSAATISSFGAARWYAALADLKRRLGQDVAIQPPSTRTTLNADERRLLADVPPHHGN